MVGQVKAYEVTVSREGRWWVAQVEGVRGGATQARRLADLEVEVTDLLAGLLETALVDAGVVRPPATARRLPDKRVKLAGGGTLDDDVAAQRRLSPTSTRRS